MSLRSGEEDSWEWKEGEEEGYTVKSGYFRLRGVGLGRETRSF